MFRRDFLTTCIVGPLLGFTESVGLTKPREYVHPELGKYVNHTIGFTTNYEDIFEHPYRYTRYVSFPLEANLRIEFEYGCFTYFAFNVPVDDTFKIRKMNIHQIMKHSEPSEDKWSVDTIMIGKNKFRMASIYVYGNKKEDNGNQA